MDDNKNSTEEGFLNDIECNIDDVVECTPTPRKKRKRGQRGPAIRYTEDQLTLLKSVYTETVYPTKAHVQYLTRLTQLPATIVRRWFNQRRCREGLGGSYERIHLIPQSVPQADVSSNAPNYKRFKTVLVQIKSPEATPRSSSSPSSASNYSSMTGYPFGHNLEPFGRQPSEQTPLKANFANTPGMKPFPYEDIYFEGGQSYSTSTPKSEIEASDSGFISLADDSKYADSPLTYDEPISSISDFYGCHQPEDLNGRSDSTVYRRGVLNEDQSDRRAYLSNLQKKVTNSNFRRRSDILEIDPKTSTLNSACGFDTSSPYTSDALESPGGSVYELEPRIFPSTHEEHCTTVPESPKTITSEPQQMTTQDPVTILQYINYKDLKKLGLGPDINYDDIPILRTGDVDPEFRHTYKPIDSLDQVGFNTGSTYKSIYTQTNPKDPYPSEPPQGYSNPSDINIATGQASRNIRGRVFEDAFTTCGGQHNKATKEYVYSNHGVSLEGQEAVRTLRMLLNRATCPTQVSTSTLNNLHRPDDVNSKLQPTLNGSQTNSGRVTAECRKGTNSIVQKTIHPIKRRMTAKTQNVPQSLAENIGSYIHPGKNVLNTKGEDLNTNWRWTKCSTCSRASTDGRSSDLQQNHPQEAYTKTTVVKEPASYGKLYEKARHTTAVTNGRRPRSPNVVVVRPPSERKYQTMDGKSHSYREATLRHNQGLESGVSRKTQKSNEILKPRVITINPKSLQVCNNDGTEQNNPKMNQTFCNTLPSNSQCCGDDLDAIFGQIDACDNLNSMELSFSNAMEEPPRPPSTDHLRSHPSNPEGFKNLTPSETSQTKSSKPQNIIKVIKVKNMPIQSNEEQQMVDGLETYLLNSSLNPETNCCINPKKSAMDDSEIRKCACHCCCCHRPSRHAQQRPLPGAPQIYILPIHI